MTCLANRKQRNPANHEGQIDNKGTSRFRDFPFFIAIARVPGIEHPDNG